MKAAETPLHDLHAGLEEVLIDQYLAGAGLTRESLQSMPPEEAAALLAEASRHASLRLAEVEARAHYTEEIHRPA